MIKLLLFAISTIILFPIIAQEHKEYYDNGNIKEFGQYRNNKKTGEWKYYLENGKLTKLISYNDSLNTSNEKQYYESGNLRSIKSYIGTKRNGEAVSYYENGQISSYWFFDHGEAVGENKSYFENGKLKTLQNFIGNSKKERTEYYKNGNIKEKINYQDRRKTGNCYYYYEAGTLDKSGAYLNNNKTGEWKFFYKNGQLKKAGKYANDDKVGEWDYYFENGEKAIANNTPEIIKKGNKPKDFVPENWKIIMQAKGDLNKDQLEDFALIIENTSIANLEMIGGNYDILNLNPRYLLIAFKNKEGSFDLIELKKNIPTQKDKDNTCLLDPLRQIFIERGSFKIGFCLDGCGQWVNSYEFTFRYQNNQFLLIGSDSNFTDKSAMATSTESKNYLTKKMKTTLIKAGTGEKIKPATWKDLDNDKLETLEGFDFKRDE